MVETSQRQPPALRIFAMDNKKKTMAMHPIPTFAISDPGDQTHSKGWPEAVLRGIQFPLVTTDLSAKITFLNEKAIEMYGEKGMIGRNAVEALCFEDPECAGQLQGSLNAALGIGKDLRPSPELPWKTVPIPHPYKHLNICPLLDGDGRAFGAVLWLGWKEDLAAPVGIAGDGIGKDAGMYVRRDGEYTRLDLGQIDAVEAMENYVQILMGEERIVVHTTMKAIQEKLKPHGFIRIHRSYLVQAEKIKGFDETRVRVGERSFPLGKSFKSELMKVVQFL